LGVKTSIRTPTLTSMHWNQVPTECQRLYTNYTGLDDPELIEVAPSRTMIGFIVSASRIRLDWNVYHQAIGMGATAVLIGSMMANAEKTAVASVRSNSSASESPCAEMLRICSSVIV
jgi:hypothetical protein